MGAYFLDSSALVKRYVAETGHGWTRALCRPAAGHTIHIAQTAHVEVIASLCRMVRERPPRLDLKVRNRLIARFRQHVQRQYSTLPVIAEVYTHAAELCRL